MVACVPSNFVSNLAMAGCDNDQFDCAFRAQTAGSCESRFTFDSRAVGEPATLVDCLRYRALQGETQVAFRFLSDGETDCATISYGELFRRAQVIAAGLQQWGCFGQRVLLVFDSGVEFIEALWGCILAGATAVPVVPPEAMRLSRTLPRFLAITADALPTAAVFASASASEAVRQSLISTCSNCRLIAWEDLSSGDGARWRPPPIEDDSPAILQYTSGSTGTPRGVLLSHGNVVSSLRAMCREDVPDAVGVTWLPPHHDFGLIGGMLLPVYAGRQTVFMPPAAFVQRPVRWLAAISKYRGTTSGAPNFAYEVCTRKIRDRDLQGIDLSSWRIAVVGAEPVRSEVLSRFADRFAAVGFRRNAFMPAYGLAEAVLNVTSGRWFEPPVERNFSRRELTAGRVCEAAAGTPDARLLVGCGRPWPGHQVVVVDPQSLRRCPNGMVGEIWVRSPNVAIGYWNRPQETRSTFDARTSEGDGPFLRTGDLGFFYDGELFVAGRIKEAIIIRGRNYDPSDLEAAVVRSHSALREGGGAAFAIEIDGQERVAIVHEVRRGPGFDADEVIEAIRRALATEFFLAPGAVTLIPGGALPRTNSGKIARLVCREAFREGRLPVVAEWRAHTCDGCQSRTRRLPQSPLELEVARHWCEVLHLDQVAIDDNFFELGGNSLSAVELYTRLQPLLPPDSSLSRLFDEPTIAGLCKLMVGSSCDCQGDPLDDLLARIEAMSEEEARRESQAVVRPPAA